MNSLLGMLRDPKETATSVLMHVLICLSYLSKERFTQAIEETHFVDRISDFVEVYSQLNPQTIVANSSHNGKYSTLKNISESEIGGAPST